MIIELFSPGSLLPPQVSPPAPPPLAPNHFPGNRKKPRIIIIYVHKYIITIYPVLPDYYY